MTEAAGTGARPGPPVAAVPVAEIFDIAAGYERAGELAKAERLLTHILRDHPTQPDALHLMGIVAFRLGRREEALAHMEGAMRHGVDTPLYLRNICELYRTLWRLDEALAAARRAVALAPADPLCLHNLAIIHSERGEYDEALACADAALRIDPRQPGAHFVRAEVKLLRGEMAEGWDEYEWRFQIAGAAPLVPPQQLRADRPQWQGERLDGKTLLLIGDQGFGDVIQFCRYIGWAREHSGAGAIAIGCGREVGPLVRQVAPDATIFEKWDECPPYAAYAALSGLPRLAGTRIDSVPAPIPYLRADAAKVAAWRARLAALVPQGFRRVGLVWAGRPAHNNDRNRSTSIATFRPLFDLPGVAFVALQKGPATPQAGGVFARAPLVNLGAEIRDYADTMAIMENLDAIVSVDTSVVHLAGALGRPVSVMIPRAPDWRWLLEREDTPWYPTMRLFRQTQPNAWDDVVARIKAEMAAVVTRP